MKDQAEKLREIASNVRQQLQAEINRTVQQTRVIVVASGKGGVGKSTLALNLSLSLCCSGNKVVLMDADLGLANIDIMLGLVPEYNLYHMIFNRKNIKDIIIAGPNGLKIIPGGSGITELANLGEEQLRRVLVELGGLDGDYDYMIIDTGAGISNNVLSFLLASDEVIVMTTPEPTSLTDAYGTIKALARGSFKGEVYMVVNRVASTAEGVLVAEKLKLVSKKFLDIDLKVLGHIVNEPLIGEGIRRQEAFISLFPRSQAAVNINLIAKKLAEGDESPVINEIPRKGGIKNFFRKLAGINRSTG